MSDEPIRIGIIGLGRATALMLSALENQPLVLVAAGADPRPQARRAFHERFGGRTFETAEELCASAELDAVVVATPPQFHADHAVMAADSGKHVLVEKPMAPTLAECDAMINAAASNGVRLLVGHTLAYSPAVRAIAHSVASREFGQLGSILSLYYTDFLYRPRRGEELSRETGGGIFLNQLPHLVDVVRLVCGGLVDEVVGAGAWAWDRTRPVVAASSAFLRLADGGTAAVIYSGYDRFDSRIWTFHVGEDGEPVTPDPGASRKRIRVHAADGTEEQLLAAHRFGSGSVEEDSPRYRQPQPGTLLVSCEGADLRPSPDGVEIFTDGGPIERRIEQQHWPAGRTDVLAELHRAVTTDLPVVHDGRWGKATMEVCLAMEAAAKTGASHRLVHQTDVRGLIESPALQ